ncbi:MAG: hypothetical protein ACT4OY_02780 [Alphaproteobacteria bacterium]
MKRTCLLVVILLLTACGAVSQKSAPDYLAERRIKLATLDAVPHCHGYGCQIVTPVSLSDKEWGSVKNIFRKKSKTPEAERTKIAKAVGLLERIIGPKDGTEHDVMGTFRETGHDQLDCVDESTNTTTYLYMLDQAGVLKFHTVLGAVVRLPLVHAGNWPHQSAMIREDKTGDYYVVDSWFRNNGADADIVDLPTWRAGWKPEELRGINL